MSFKFDEKAAKDKLARVREAHEKTQGKPGYNPNLYLQNVVAPIEKQLRDGEKTEELYNLIMGLSETPKPTSQSQTGPQGAPIGEAKPVSTTGGPQISTAEGLKDASTHKELQEKAAKEQAEKDKKANPANQAAVKK